MEQVLETPQAMNGVRANGLAKQFQSIRAFTLKLCEPLKTEDFVIQSMPDASPAKWHLAHTTWFFETFVIKPFVPGYTPSNPQYNYIFNSYYNTVGPFHPRSQRGLLSRPTVKDIFKYRREIDILIAELLEIDDEAVLERVRTILTLGLHHEQQHQELMLTDIKHLFSQDPSRPVYRPRGTAEIRGVAPLKWAGFEGGIYELGHSGIGFCFDNEQPRHRALLEPFSLASRLVTNGEYLEFILDGGYQHHDLWLSQGWRIAQELGWRAPLYWEMVAGQWQQMTLAGMRELNPNEPVCHVSLFEADAFARWSGARLPSEKEWELAAEGMPMSGNLAETEVFHPQPSPSYGGAKLTQMFGDVWEWTHSPYSPYPGYKPAAGAIGEYNGKFMCNQFVLRGGSCATPRSHIRATYRNFFPAEARWQFMGIRLAKETV